MGIVDVREKFEVGVFENYLWKASELSFGLVQTWNKELKTHVIEANSTYLRYVLVPNSSSFKIART